MTRRHYDPTDALDALAQQQILHGICSEPTCQWPIAGWCANDGCRAKLCYDHLQEHRNQHQPPPVRFHFSAENIADAIEREAEAVEWTECDECSVVYPRHELAKCPGCGLLLCENCAPHGSSCENYDL